jgi:magnesium chelatase family protein
MMLSMIHSAAIYGIDAVLIEVEVDVTKMPEKLTFVIVGLPDTAVKESKDRVLAAIKNSGFVVGSLHCTVNLAPGDLRKEGAMYDLPIALGLLRSLGFIKNSLDPDYLVVGELGLSGEMRPMQGALPMAMLARKLGKKGLLLPAANAKEAAAVPGVKIFPIHHLKEAVKLLENPQAAKPVCNDVSESIFKHVVPSIDFADIKGQSHVKRAVEIAAAGNHNIILSGPPGAGKSMIAKALVGIMPELTFEEALETTKIHSVAGLLRDGQNLVVERPFRSPHHTISYAGLIGGGAVPRPGEVSLAHNGILFLDELPEFSRTVLEVLRQPLEDRKVTISRANGNFTYPTNILCIAAMNPCPCGFLGHPEKTCRDTQAQIERYRGKISGPVWERLDMHIEVPALKYSDILNSPQGEPSAIIRERVRAARHRQYNRFGCIRTNAQMHPKDLKKYCQVDGKSQEIIRQAIDVMGLSARACDKLLRVSLTIADLAGLANIEQAHVMEALSFRNQQVSAPGT